MQTPAVLASHAPQDEGSIILLALYVSIALVFSFLCSVAEAVFLSTNPAFIESKRESSPKLAQLLAHLKGDHVDRSLAAILTLNTIAHTVGAIASGAEASLVFGNAWFGVFSAVMTLAILFFSEIIPKTIGAIYWGRLARPVAYFIPALNIILLPLVWLSEQVTKLLSRKQEQHTARDELLAMARVGARNGAIASQESRILENLFALKSLSVRDIMTPRTVIGALPENTSIAEATVFATEHPFSRIPLYTNDLDNFDGFVLRGDILLANLQGKTEDKVDSLRRLLPVVSSSQPLSNLLTRLVENRFHICAAVNEYGVIEGIVTLEDLFETLMGIEIVDEMDKAEDMQQLARQLWRDRMKSRGISDIPSSNNVDEA